MINHTVVCANHPDRETTLRCNRCEKPICPQCAVHTPVGYRCRECVHSHQKIFDTVRKIDYPIVGMISAVGLGVAILLLNPLGWWGFFIAPVVGGGLANVVRWAIGRRRGRYLPLTAVIGGVVGVLLSLVFMFFRFAYLVALGTILVLALVPIVMGGLMLSALYYRLRGINL